MNIQAYTDNRSLYDILYTTKLTSEKSLIVDVASIREMIDKEQVKVLWVEGQKQLSDVLTKAGASSIKLNDTLKAGKLLM